MKIYIDDDFRCHVSNDGTLREFETDFFDGKCRAFIEGYRYVPQGEVWVRDDGEEFGGMVAPFKPYDQLAEAQQAYEEAMADVQTQIDDMRSALEIVGVTE